MPNRQWPSTIGKTTAKLASALSVNGQGHCLVYTLRGTRMRLIAFRRAHEEMRRHGQ